MSWSGATVGGLSLAAVLAFVLYESERPSPGPLHPSHAAVAELDACDACHSDGVEWASSCGRCHQTVAAQIAQPSGFHGRLGADAGACTRCHVEHHGADLPLAGPRAFAAAGIEALADFDHDAHAGRPTGLAGRHSELTCVACHENADAPSLAAGQRRFLGLDAGCATCHEDSHEGAFGTRCESCHGQQEPFAGATGFDHTRFPLVDAHSVVECAKCHVDVQAAATDRPPTVRACVTCHESPHAAGPLFLRRSDDCSRCHDSRSFAGTAFGGEAHAAIGAPLTGRHADAACADCHSPARLADGMPACAACHDDVHTGKPPLAERPRALWAETRDCAECHDEHGFGPALVGGGEHERFGPALEGAHAEGSCAACHDSLQAPASPDACAACHDSPHRAEFVAGDACATCHAAAAATFAGAGETLEIARHTDLALTAPHDLECSECHAPGDGFADRFRGRNADDCGACHVDPHADEFTRGAFAGATCRACHASDRFTPSSFTPALHARTELPLEGSHAAVACAACHHQQNADAQRRFDLSSTACKDCHADPHSGAFDGPGLPSSVKGRTGCARCHTTETFRGGAAAAFDHAAWAGRPLAGEHATAACNRCHDRMPDGSLGAAPSACADCHADPHRGQFRRENGTNCARCHEERGTFSDLHFDHDRDSRMALDADHARLACASCHRPVALKGGETMILYRPLGTSCRDCHASGFGADRDEPR